MKIFEVQDSLLLLDCDPVFQLDHTARNFAKKLIETNFESFVSYLFAEYPDSKASRFIKVSQGIDEIESAPSMEENRCWIECTNLAEAGYAPAAFLLYYLYDTGLFGCPKMPEKSEQYEAFAGSLGHPQALWNSGIVLLQTDSDLGNNLILRSALLGFGAAIQHVRMHGGVFGDFERNVCTFETKYEF